MITSASNSASIMDFGTADGAGAGNFTREVPVGDLDELSMNASSIGSNTILHQSVEILGQRTWSQFIYGGRARLRGMRQLPASSNGMWPGALDIASKRSLAKGKPKLFPQIVYRNICFLDDPPCSVAISPARHCVAFGCRGGVEIYWVDPTTGQNLNRYFSLARPSENLYFLPPRQNIDSQLRLRLISSSNYSSHREDTTPSTGNEDGPVSF